MDNERYLTDKLFRGIGTIKTYSFTTGNICYDGTCTTTNDVTILFEVKVRSFKADKYPDYILQVDKLISLINRAKNMNLKRIYYINYFITDTPGVYDFIIFNLTPRIEEWKKTKAPVVQKSMNAATFKSTENKIIKEVILLKYDETMDARGNFVAN